MAYLGNVPARSFISFERQVFTIVNSQTAYTLSHSVTNENDIRLVINNVVQEPGSGKAYTASGTTLTLSAALTNGTDEMYCVFLGRAVGTVNAPAGSVAASQLAADSVTAAKLNDDIISGQTELATAPADTDEFLISDAGVLKRIDASLVVGGGIVTQVVYTSSDTNVTFTNSTFGDVITLNITPTKTSSDILIQANLTQTANSTTGQDQGSAFKILRDTTQIFTTDAYQTYVYSNGANIDSRQNASVAYLDTAHNTTSQITYKIQANNQTGGGSVTFNQTGKSTLWIMELDQ